MLVIRKLKPSKGRARPRPRRRCPPNSHGDILTLSASKCGCVWKVSRVRPIPIALVSLEEEVRTQTCTEGRVASRPHAQGGDLRGNQLHRPLELGLRPPELQDTKCLWLKPPGLCCFVTETVPCSAPLTTWQPPQGRTLSNTPLWPSY